MKLNRFQLSASLAMALLIAVGVIPVALHADEKLAKPSSLDEQLLKDLDNELLEGLDDLPKPKKSPAESDGPTAPSDAAGEDLGQPSESNPLERVARQMRQVERLIPEPEETARTTKSQEQIVGSLDELIKQLEKQCQKSGSSSGSKPGSPPASQRDPVKQPQSKPGEGKKPSDKPSRESSKRRGPDEVRPADVAELQNMMKDVWGQLPAKAREQMLQSPPERFLPKYELLIEKYYRRLAEERGDQQ